MALLRFRRQSESFDNRTPIHVWGFGITCSRAGGRRRRLILRSRPWHPAIGFTSSALDVLVTTALVSFALVSSPLDA
jgi:hypothetical protein